MTNLDRAAVQASSRQASLQRLGAWAGIVGPILFTIVYTVDGWFQPNYSAISEPASNLAVVNNGWIQITNFIIFALLALLFAFSFALGMRVLIAQHWLLVSTILLVVAGLGFLNDAVFSAAASGESPNAPHVVLHTIGFEVIFTSLALACIIAGWQLRKAAGWRGYGWYSIITAVITLFPVVFVVFSPSLSNGAHPQMYGGLFERIFISITFAWYVVMGFRLLRMKRA
jgi:hypothetical protein